MTRITINKKLIYNIRCFEKQSNNKLTEDKILQYQGILKSKIKNMYNVNLQHWYDNLEKAILTEDMSKT